MIIEYNNEEMEEMIEDSYEYYMGLVELIELNRVIKNEVLGRIIEESING
jgi:NurA-like 5'-3' nuclease